MNNLTRILLSGAALGALATAPAMAQQKPPAFSFMALHAGRVVNKTRLYNPHRCGDDSCTEYVYTSVPASDFQKRVPLALTFYKLNSNGTICNSPRQRLLAPKKSMYGKVGAATETYSEGCASGPTTFYGDTYKLTNPAGEGRTDNFVSRLIGKIRYGSHTYKETLYIEAYVAIGTE